MTYDLMTEDAVKKYLHISDFRNINKKDVIKLVSNLHRMDPAIAVKCIEQFPDFAKASVIMIQNLSETCDKAITANNNETKCMLELYKDVLASLSERLAVQDVSIEEKELLSKALVDVGNQIIEIKKMASTERIHIVNSLGKCAIACVSILATAVGAGIAIKDGTIPRLANSIRDNID